MTIGSDVVEFRAAQAAMRFRQISEVRAYWQALRRDDQVPMRAWVDPRGIERSLEHAFILERVAPRVARFRLAGMQLSDLAGMEVRGLPFSTLFSAESRAEAAEVLDQVFVGPAIAEMVLSAPAGYGQGALDARLILLPLRSDLGDVSRALGCLVAEGAIGRAPRRLDLAGLTVAPLGAGKAEGAARPTPAPSRGLAEDSRPFEGPKPAHGHLRLVKSDR
jgi:hypothetical protein